MDTSEQQTTTSNEVNKWHTYVDKLERGFRPFFRRFSKLGGPKYFNTDDFPVAKTLSENHEVIRAEFDSLRHRMQEFPVFQDISPEQIYISNDDKWKMFFLKSMNTYFEKNCELFPETIKVIKTDKNIVSAYFSILGPRKMLVPHEGPWSGILRMHMGVDIPTEGKGCVLSLEGEEYRWKEGEVVVFDDTYEHFAANLTDRPRVVLFMDYLRPMPWPLHIFNKLCIYISRFVPYYKVPMQRHKAWEEKFYGMISKGESCEKETRS